MKSGLATYNRSAQHNRDQLILENVDYVARILSTMTHAVSSGEARENLHSAGVVGLVEAANAFDPAQGVPFRTFAYPRIRGAIVDEMRKQAPVSQFVLQQIGIVKKNLRVAGASGDARSSGAGVRADGGPGDFLPGSDAFYQTR